MKKEPLLSIVIPTFNEEKDIDECLSTLFNQNYKNLEIIIIDDGSTDRTLEIVKKYKKVKIFKQNHRGPGLARNLGASHSKGEILIFVDADMSFPSEFLGNLVKPIIEGKTIGTTREMEIVKNTDNIWSRCWGKIRVTKDEAKNAAAFRAIKKSDFLRMGGFDPKYGYADDQTFRFKYGIRPMVAPNALCYHKNPETLKGVYRQSKWIGASIDNAILNIPGINFIAILLLVLLSPIAIIFLSFRKCYKNKDFAIILPMFIFTIARYFGNLSGIINKIYFNKNVR
jgi:glycosyltransferase involved in cell wall biosynthesis